MSAEISRRSLLRAAGLAAGAVAIPSALGACGDGAKSGVGNAGAQLAPWPTYKPAKIPAPDLAGNASGLQHGYTKYPANLGTATSGVPGDGSKVRAVVITYGTPPAPKETNKFLQAINAALGINLELTVIPDADYQAKMATLMAGDDLPDLINFGGGYVLPREAEFVASKFADLSEHLSGDAVLAYPNLASIPGYAWKGMGRIKGRIMGVPVERPATGSLLYVNRQLWQGAGLADKAVSDGWTKAEFFAGAKALSKDRRYALGASKAGFFGFQVHCGAFGAPNLWKVENGAFTPTYATEEFKQALLFMRDLQSAGAYYPDAMTVSQVDAKTQFAGQTTASITDGFGAYQTLIPAAKGAYDVVPALPYQGGASGAKQWASRGIFGYTVIKKAPAERVKMLLRVLDFLSASFGTKEYELLHHGVEGTHFTRNSSGAPVQTETWTGGENRVNLPVGYLGDAPAVLYYAGVTPAQITAMHSFERKTEAGLVYNPAFGLTSDAASRSEAGIKKAITDALVAFVSGRSTVSDWDNAVKKYLADGGSKMAEEYAKEYAAAN